MSRPPNRNSGKEKIPTSSPPSYPKTPEKKIPTSSPPSYPETPKKEKPTSHPPDNGPSYPISKVPHSDHKNSPKEKEKGSTYPEMGGDHKDKKESTYPDAGGDRKEEGTYS